MPLLGMGGQTEKGIALPILPWATFSASCASRTRSLRKRPFAVL
jgi:hypothetical protein